jgi:hypothetical protein
VALTQSIIDPPQISGHRYSLALALLVESLPSQRAAGTSQILELRLLGRYKDGLRSYVEESLSHREIQPLDAELSAIGLNFGTDRLRTSQVLVPLR